MQNLLLKLLSDRNLAAVVVSHNLAEAAKLQVSATPTSLAANLYQKGAEYLGLKVPIIKQSLQYTPLEMVSAADAKQDLEFWFKRLMEQNPKFLGGNLPDAGFYYV